MHDARGRRAIARDITERDLHPVDDRVLDRFELRWCRTRVGGPAPVGRIDDDGRGRGFGVGAERLGQRAHELAQRGLDLRRRRRRRAGDEEQRTRFRRGEAAEIGPGAADELPPAVATGTGIDGHAGHPERFEVPAGGPLRDLQLGRDFGRRDLATSLQEHEDGDEAVSAHARILARNPDRS